MQLITLLGAGFFFVVLYLRYKSQPKEQKKVNPARQFRTVKALVIALIAWLAVSFTLQHMLGKMDGADHEPSWWERVVSYLSK